jgi:transcriptional regulator with XRE-family HTH domain
MSKRKPMDKTQARERRNHLLESAAAAELSLTEGVREMRAISGMTQEEFAQHRGVSARVIKAIELGQGNPTVATLNRIGQFFGLEVAFVPVKRAATAGSGVTDDQARNEEKFRGLADTTTWEAIREAVEAREHIVATVSLAELDDSLVLVNQRRKHVQNATAAPEDPPEESRPARKPRKARSP